MLKDGKDNDKGLAILCGYGDLPRLLAEKCQRENRHYRVFEFASAPLDWTEGHPVIKSDFEKADAVIKAIKENNCTELTMAGGISRPKLNPFKYDLKGMKLAASILGARKKGDDETLKIIVKMFEDEGLKVVSAQSVLGELIPESGVHTEKQPNQADKSDAKAAAQIVDAIGKLDIGQGCVVAQGICLAVETIQGTDKMLEFVAETRENYVDKSSDGQGVLYKAPKTQQDRRVDLPAVGVKTIENASKAGLSGVVIEAGGVMVLGLDEVIKAANRLGVFLWVRPKT